MSEQPMTVTYSLEDILTRLDQKMDRLEDKIDGLETKLEDKIDDLETRLEGKIDALETKLEGKIDALETKLEGKIDALETKLEGKINKQSEEIASIKSTLQAQQLLIQKIPDLAEKVGELKNWRQIVIITITATFSGFIGWLIRGGNLKP